MGLIDFKPSVDGFLGSEASPPFEEKVPNTGWHTTVVLSFTGGAPTLYERHIYFHAKRVMTYLQESTRSIAKQVGTNNKVAQWELIEYIPSTFKNANNKAELLINRFCIKDLQDGKKDVKLTYIVDPNAPQKIKTFFKEVGRTITSSTLFSKIYSEERRLSLASKGKIIFDAWDKALQDSENGSFSYFVKKNSPRWGFCWPCFKSKITEITAAEYDKLKGHPVFKESLKSIIAKIQRATKDSSFLFLFPLQTASSRQERGSGQSPSPS